MTAEIRTSDGELLSVRLKKVEKRKRITAFLLAAPLLFFIIFTYIIPIFQMLGRSIDNVEMHSFLTKTHEVMQEWDGSSMPSEDVTSTFYYDLKNAVENGSRNIDVGCMQLNYRWHKGGFSSLEDMFDPIKNINYAAEFVKELFERHKNWEDTIKHYHSNKEKFNTPYHKKVAKVWDEKKENGVINNPLGFSSTENILPVAEKKSIFIKEVEPIIVYDASSKIEIIDTSQILNESGIPFEGNRNKHTSNLPTNVPKFMGIRYNT